MPAQTDRGIAALIDNTDGTITIALCAAVRNGRPVNVHAKYVGVPNVRIAPGIRLTRGSSCRYTSQIVEVAPAEDAIHVRMPGRGLPI